MGKVSLVNAVVCRSCIIQALPGPGVQFRRRTPGRTVSPVEKLQREDLELRWDLGHESGSSVP